MIRFQTSHTDISPTQLRGFFHGWPNPPTPETHLRILQGSDEIVLAIDDEAGAVVGFITAMTDGVLSAFVPLLEVLPGYRGRSIGSELVRRMLARLDGLYMIDLMCDADVQPFYERLGLTRATGMMKRDYAAQHGRTDPS